MEYNDLRIFKLREYLISVIDEINKNEKATVNVDMLSNKIDDYSIDKMPVDTEAESWIIGVTKNREAYTLRTRKRYSQDTINNLMNIGFFEKFQEKIKYNNLNKILPEIENIEGIKCLNCGTLIFADTNTAEFSIQIEIVYREYNNNNQVSI